MLGQLGGQHHTDWAEWGSFPFGQDRLCKQV